VTRDELLAEIANRKPWYQRIEFPEFGVTTTDDEANAMLDAAWDNAVDGISLRSAALLRPQPKWKAIRGALPPVAGLDVLEIGSNCGYFTFQFAAMGARSVVGLDVSPHWLSNAEWCRSVLGYSQVNFTNCDFMAFDPARPSPEGLLRDELTEVPIPNNCYDVVFMSTVLDHLFFPLFAIYKMIRIARRYVVIDVPQFRPSDPSQSLLNLSAAPDSPHHGFTATIPFITSYIGRLGVRSSAIAVYPYNNSNSVTYVIDTSAKKDALVGA